MSRLTWHKPARLLLAWPAPTFGRCFGQWGSADVCSEQSVGWPNVPVHQWWSTMQFCWWGTWMLALILWQCSEPWSSQSLSSPGFWRRKYRSCCRHTRRCPNTGWSPMSYPEVEEWSGRWTRWNSAIITEAAELPTSTALHKLFAQVCIS